VPSVPSSASDAGPSCESQITTASSTTVAVAAVQTSLGTQSKQPGTRDTKAAASDVWYFMWAVNSPEKPETMPVDQPQSIVS
jgi:hypothetical protein